MGCIQRDRLVRPVCPEAHDRLYASFSNTCRETPLWRLFLRPLLLTRLPAVIWASVIYGIVLGWVVLQTTANATAFPVLYGFSSLGVGNINIAVSIRSLRIVMIDIDNHRT